MTLTATNICNMALDLLNEATLTNYLTDDTRVSNWFVRNYETCRDAEFEAHPWAFAKARVTITKNATAPIWGRGYRYALPADFMRFAYINYDGTFEGTPIPHEIESADPADAADLAAAPRGWLLSDESPTVRLVYIRQIVNPDRWLKLFAQALAAEMARKLAHWLTGKQSMVQVAQAAYDLALRKAKLANALLSTPERAYDSDVIAARYTSGGGWYP